MKDIDKIKKILELNANYQKQEQCVVCGAKTDSVYFYNYSNKEIGHLICKECNQLQIVEDDVKGNYSLEYLYKKVFKK